MALWGTRTSKIPLLLSWSSSSNKQCIYCLNENFLYIFNNVYKEILSLLIEINTKKIERQFIKCYNSVFGMMMLFCFSFLTSSDFFFLGFSVIDGWIIILHSKFSIDCFNVLKSTRIIFFGTFNAVHWILPEEQDKYNSCMKNTNRIRTQTFRRIVLGYRLWRATTERSGIEVVFWWSPKKPNKSF